MAFSSNALSRLTSVVLDGTTAPRATHLVSPRFSVVLEAMHKACRGPLRSAVSAQKALQGSEIETTELLEGTREKSISPYERVTMIMFFLKTLKIELVARPDILQDYDKSKKSAQAAAAAAAAAAVTAGIHIFT